MANPLEPLHQYDAFVHTELSMEEIRYLFKPFGEISKSNLEEDLRHAISNAECAVVKANRGSGKSSSVDFTLLGAENAFPIILSPIVEDPVEVCQSVENFVRFMLNQLDFSLKSFKGIDEKARAKAREALSMKIGYVESRKQGLTGRIKGVVSLIPAIIGIESEVTSDLETFTSTSLDRKVYNTERLNCILDLCGVIERSGRNPVFFIDDTDKFLKRDDLDRSTLVPMFFGKILPALVKMGKPIVIAAHPDYERSDAFKEASKNEIDTTFEIPHLEQSGTDAVLQRRIESVVPKLPLLEVFDEKALSSLFEHYQKNGYVLRGMMLLAKEGLTRALNQGQSRITLETLQSI
ncbi:MAG: hypothetical protein ACLP9K_09505 [Nitrososphaerales archaeon]